MVLTWVLTFNLKRIQWQRVTFWWHAVWKCRTGNRRTINEKLKKRHEIIFYAYHIHTHMHNVLVILYMHNTVAEQYFIQIYIMKTYIQKQCFITIWSNCKMLRNGMWLLVNKSWRKHLLDVISELGKIISHKEALCPQKRSTWWLIYWFLDEVCCTFLLLRTRWTCIHPVDERLTILNIFKLVLLFFGICWCRFRPFLPYLYKSSSFIHIY